MRPAGTAEEAESRKKTRRARFREIVTVLARHGIRGGIRHMTDPVQLRLALEELGPTFIKIGQILSMRRDILPDSYLREFQKLQDNVRPESFEKIRGVVERSLGRPLESVFDDFGREPIASASLSQVHRARLKDGRDVVVKVRRPGVRETMLSDIAILRMLSRLGWFLPENNIISFRELIGEIEDNALQELNFLNEKENLKKFREYNGGVRYISCPSVVEELTTSNVLVMDYIDGIKISDTQAIRDAGYDLAEIGDRLVANYLKQIFEDGFFHADPHPGNLMIADHRIVYMDFGMVGTLSGPMRGKFNSFLIGLATSDVDAMAKVILRIGIVKGTVDRERLYADVGALYDKYSAATIDEIKLPELLKEIFSVCAKNNISLPREMTMLWKGTLTIEGLLSRIAPEMNLTSLTVAYARHSIFKEKAAPRDLSELAEDWHMLYLSGTRTYAKLMELLNGTLNGRLTLKMDFKHGEKNLESLNHMVNRIVFALVLASLLIGSSLVVYADAGPKIHGASIIGLLGYAAAMVVGLWLLISILRSNRF